MGAMTGYSSHSPIPDISDVTSPVQDENVAAFSKKRRHRKGSKRTRTQQFRDSQAIGSTADGVAAPRQSNRRSNRRRFSAAPRAPATTAGAGFQGPATQSDSEEFVNRFRR
eukprot:GHVP01023555.1.p1 GENE.GHVP01023555.1~~GHVP01023555.1.p1  ORF type:complete len:111 (+),score=19.42 GHVP01023555.1:55-387(+)